MVAGRPSFRYQVLIGLLSTLMVGCVLGSLSGFWRLNAPWTDITIIALVAVLFSLVTRRFPWLGATLMVLAAGAAIGATRYLPDWDRYLVRAIAEGAEFWNTVRFFKFDTTFGPTIGMVFLVAIGLAAALAIVTESMARGKTFWAIAAGTAVFGSEWAWFYDRSESYFASYLVLAFALWILGQAAQRDAGWLASGRKVGYRSHVTAPIAWVLAVGMVALVLPTDFSPLDLGALGQKVQNALPILKQMRGGGVGGLGSRFSLRGTGFSPNMGALGGPVKLDNAIALKLTPDRSLGETLYLRGATHSVYNGETWLPGSPQDVPVPSDGNLPGTYGSDVMQEDVTVKITHAVNIGQTLFSVLEPKRVDDLKVTYTADADGNLWAKKAVDKGASYRVTARTPLYSAEQIRLLSTSAPSDSYKAYLQRPATLPKRVTELAQSITAGHAHPFDKAVALERYLSAYTYDLNAPGAPSGRDFVDYFLFDLKRGYCTYYSTAMTVMLREIGIPSRLVEGFAVPPSADSAVGTDGKPTYDVLNSQAHAWVEAYFPAYGWVTFEPTPRSDLNGIDRSRPLPEKSTTNSETGVTSGDNASSPQSPNRRNLVEDFNEGGPSGTAVPQKRQWPWAILSVLAAAGLIFSGYQRLKKLDRVRATDEREVVQEVWDKTGTVMQRFDFGPRPHQTAREYAVALGKAWPSLKEPAIEVADDYTAARYSPPQASHAQVEPEKARDLWSKALHALFERYGWRTYLWRRLGWSKGSDQKTDK